MRAKTAIVRTKAASAAATKAIPNARWYVYVLRCGDQSLYTGIAKDVAARLAAHRAGSGARYTRSRGPLQVCKTRRCASKGAALKLEYAVKQLSKARKEWLLQGERLAQFARQLE